MGNHIMQWRRAIGCHNNFVKCKEFKCIYQLIKRIKDLWSFFGATLFLLLLNISPDACYLTILLLRCRDIESNPGPTTFCHLNARSLLSGVDLNKHIDSQYSLLDEIYECLVYVNDFDMIAIGETWLTENVSDSDLSISELGKVIQLGK